MGEHCREGQKCGNDCCRDEATMDRAPPLRAEKSTTWARGVINEAKSERDECKHEAKCATVASAMVAHMAAGATEAA